jgi:uncharacterized protein HemX
MQSQNIDFNLSAIKKMTKVLLISGSRIRQKKENQGELKTKKLKNIMEKIEMLELKYRTLKRKNRNDLKMDNIKIHLNLIKNKLKEIA